MANCRERPSHDEGPDTRDAREYRPRPAIRRGWQGHGRARPRAREAWDALSLPQLTAGPRGDPLAGKTREGPDHAGFPGGRRPRGDLTRAVFGVVSERTPAKARLHMPYVPGRLVPVSAHGYGSQPDLAGTSSRGRPTECFAASGSRAGTSPGGVLRHLGRRAPSRSSTGGGGTCRTQARRLRGPSWTPSSPDGQTRQASCWALCWATAPSPSATHGGTTGTPSTRRSPRRRARPAPSRSRRASSRRSGPCAPR